MARKKKARKIYPIQVGTIIYNEEKRLPLWLAHWQPLAERIIVIDQGSNDKTQQILTDSGVTWFERLPRGNPDIHWNDLIGLSRANMPFFRIGVDEFISRSGIRNALKIMKVHSRHRLWWLSRKNWIDGVNVNEHPEIFQKMGFDWQATISFGRACIFSGRMHGWPTVKVPGHQAGYMDRDLVWIDHQRTWEDVERANASREHVCGEAARQDQIWFTKAVREILDKRNG